MGDILELSVKNAARLGRCRSCDWRNLRFQQQVAMPGIFYDIDIVSKAAVDACYARYARLPQWLRGFLRLVEPIPVPNWRQFQYLDRASQVRLRGCPDSLFRRDDASMFISDFKTARYTRKQDELQDTYRLQLGGYGYIGNHIGYGPTTGLGLIFAEPATDVSADSIDSVLTTTGFAIQFHCRLIDIDLAAIDEIPKLLLRARELYELPPPRPEPTCQECRRFVRLAELLSRLNMGEHFAGTAK